ncbi:MAG: hypothetical protein HKO65_10315, partial [Gemmatimonadetes bacterium]|nr:hypothetical protein [Gemmatimonadota bacterium]
MRDHDDKYRVYLDGGVGQGPDDPQQEVHDPQLMNEVPFCLGIVGDFSGRGNRSDEESHTDLAQRPLQRVTPENALKLAGLSPEIIVTRLTDAPAEISVPFST